MASGVTYYGRIDTNTLSHFFKNAVWDGTINFRAFWAAIKKRGHVETGLDGKNLVWNTTVGRHTMSAYDDGEVVNITRKKQEVQCALPWAFLYISDAITRDEIAMNSGDAAMRRTNKDLLSRMQKTFVTRLNAMALTQDGNASGTNVLHGLETMFAATGANTLKVMTRNDTYAGITTVSGGITTVDNAEGNAWSPTIINTSHTGWATTGVTLRANLREILTFAHTSLSFGSDPEDQLDLCVTDRDSLVTIKDVISSNQRLIVNTNSATTSNIGLGISGGIEYDGVEYVFDNDQQAGVLNWLNFNHIFLDVLQVPAVPSGSIPGGGGSSKDDMFECLVKDDDITSNGILARVNFRAQLRMHPKYQGKGAPFP